MSFVLSSVSVIFNLSLVISGFLTTLRTILEVVRDTLSPIPRLTLTESSSGKFFWFLEKFWFEILAISLCQKFDGELTCFSSQLVRRSPENWSAAGAGGECADRPHHFPGNRGARHGYIVSCRALGCPWNFVGQVLEEVLGLPQVNQQVDPGFDHSLILVILLLSNKKLRQTRDSGLSLDFSYPQGVGTSPEKQNLSSIGSSPLAAQVCIYKFRKETYAGLETGSMPHSLRSLSHAQG